MTCPQSADPQDPHNSPPTTVPQPVVSDGEVARAIIARRRAGRKQREAAPETRTDPGPSSSTSDAVTLSKACLIRNILSGRELDEQPEEASSLPFELLALMSCTEDQLMASLGVRRAAARRLRWAFDLHRRLLGRAVPARSLRRPEDIAIVMHPLVQLDHERFWCLPLDTMQRLIGSPLEVTRGDVDGTEAGPRLICRAAARAGAITMVVVHNHPTGDLRPSGADVAITRRLVAGGHAIDIPLLDHLIVSADGQWCSLRRIHPDLFSARPSGYSTGDQSGRTSAPGCSGIDLVTSGRRWYKPTPSRRSGH